MSIDDAKPEDWDAIKADRYYDNRPIEDWDPMRLVQTVTTTPEKPQHYRVGEVEAIDYIHQQLGSGVKDYLLGNVHKYLHRHRFKGQAVEDLRKAEWYLRKLIMEECNL